MAKQTFKVGDTVVYPAQGAGTVEELTKREVLGETRDYLRLSFVRGEMDVLVPLNKTTEVGLRHTFKLEDIDKLVTTLLAGEMKLPPQWPPRHRFELDVLSRAEAFELASMIGTLTKRDLEKGLADTEREIMERAKNMLASELAVVQKLTLDKAKQRINEELEHIT
ncbi:MAG: CarD family transcriptional regulator [Deinococcales bacterium]